MAGAQASCFPVVAILLIWSEPFLPRSSPWHLNLCLLVPIWPRVTGLAAAWVTCMVQTSACKPPPFTASLLWGNTEVSVSLDLKKQWSEPANHASGQKKEAGLCLLLFRPGLYPPKLS